MYPRKELPVILHVLHVMVVTYLFFFPHHSYIFFLSFASDRRLGKSQIIILCFLLSLLYASKIIVFVTFCSKVVKQFAANKVLIVNSFSVYSDSKGLAWRMKDLSIQKSIPQELFLFFCFVLFHFVKSTCHGLTQKAAKHNWALHLLPPSGGDGGI